MDQVFLMEMLHTASVSGNEAVLEKKIYDYMENTKACDEVRTDEIGDVIGILNPDSPCKILLCGHADEIGLMITAVTEQGMLKVTKIGGIYPSCYLGQKVRIHTSQGILYGAVVNTRELSKKKDLEPKDLTIDIGADSKEEALKQVSLGDTITLDTDCRELLNDKITGRALDNRLGAFIVMQALLLAKEKGAKAGIYSAATVGEETTRNGAYFTSSRIHPTMAIAVDVTYTSDYPGVSEAETGEIKVGGGPVLCNNPSVHKKINEMLLNAAKRLNQKIQIEAANGQTSTDGDVVHQSGDGVPFALISIPLRYMHSPAEVGSLKDVEACIELLAEFLAEMPEDVDLKLF